MTPDNENSNRESMYKNPGSERMNVRLVYVDEKEETTASGKKSLSAGGKNTGGKNTGGKNTGEKKNITEKKQEIPPKRSVKKEGGDGPRETETPAIDKPKAPEENIGGKNGGKPEKKKKKHLFGKLLLVLFILAAALFVLFFIISGKVNYAPLDASYDTETAGLPEKYEKGVVNILLIGSDTRSSTDRGQSDSMILVSVCPLQHKIYLTSFLRDSYVDIPGYGRNRLNHAYTMGGASLLKETIEQNFGVRIDNYFRVDFSSFIDIVDAFGGVEIEVEPAEVQYVDAYLSEINQLMGIDARDSFIYVEGTYTLNGRQALAYSRIRYIGTDFGRTSRQRTVIKALVKKVRKTNPVTTVKALNTALSALTTGMDRKSLTLFMMRAPFLLFYKIESGQIPADNTWWNALTESGQEVLDMDFEANRSYLKDMIYKSGFLSFVLDK